MDGRVDGWTGLEPQVCHGAVRHVREGIQAGLEPRGSANRAVHVLRRQADGLRRRSVGVGPGGGVGGGFSLSFLLLSAFVCFCLLYLAEEVDRSLIYRLTCLLYLRSFGRARGWSFCRRVMASSGLYFGFWI